MAKGKKSAKAKGKKKASAKKVNWNKCAGVDKETHRIKPGYRPRPGGGCPEKGKSAKPANGRRKSHAAPAHSHGPMTAAQAWQMEKHARSHAAEAHAEAESRGAFARRKAQEATVHEAALKRNLETYKELHGLGRHSRRSRRSRWR